jgi:threonine/homoserine/homoserine lactone efflux protein
MFELTLALLLFLLPLAYSPGPGNMFFAAIGGRFGLLASLPATAGYHFATFVVTGVIGLGFSELAETSSTLFEILRYGGSAYFFWLAWQFFRAGATTGIAEARKPTALDGAFLLILNPKAYLIVVLMFSQFLSASGTSDASLVLWITTVFTVNNLVAFTIWTLAGDLMLRQFRNTSAARSMNIVFGVIFIAVASWMLLH